METDLKVFKSDRFDIQEVSGLSLFLYPHSLHIFAKDANGSNSCIHSYSSFSENDLDKLILSDQLMRNDLPINVYIHQSYFALVPGVLFQPENEAVYLEFAGKPKGNLFYFNSALDSNNLQIVSAIPEKVKKSLDARFSEINLFHGSVSILSYLFKERFNLIGQEILIYSFEGHMYATAFSDQELAVFNMFDIDTEDDILKYILILIKQLKYDRIHVRITILGFDSALKITEDWGKSYFQNFRIISPTSNQNYNQGFKNLKSLNLFEVNWQYS
ncbi:DUF3822 family protein [Algoriphagus marinus]|uniref:DUF3822 family protein n=1 Tax=Algoriphagus marinus TaxID=1925762 RepID=UPI0009F88677|nr:DUF3822 family protein [Algoriphagus marinus]